MVQLGKMALVSKQASRLPLLEDTALVHDHHFVTGHHTLQAMCHLQTTFSIMQMLARGRQGNNVRYSCVR